MLLSSIWWIVGERREKMVSVANRLHLNVYTFDLIKRGA